MAADQLVACALLAFPATYSMVMSAHEAQICVVCSQSGGARERGGGWRGVRWVGWGEFTFSSKHR
jgi:hypothetical protein